MIGLAESLVSSSARKLPIRKRPDLSARKQSYLGRTYWVVKDPIGLNYFRFQEEEYAILQMLDGQTSLDEIKARFEEEFPPQKITLEELHQFLGMLHRSGLILSGVPGQGQQLFTRRAERKRQEWIATLTNILCIRFKGFDPERILNWLEPRLRWIFSPLCLSCCLLLAMAAATLVTVQFDVFRSKLPAFHQFFNAHNAVWLAVVLGLTKIVHEFGHGLTCKHYGGECHEMGVMILVLTPCLYCNVSDSWMLPNKWHRAAIGAAGMCVEVVLASICTFIWWFTEPGMLNHLCLNVMFISSVSTIVFNANPLLRYDGYYILADIMEIPNLRQKATAILSRKAGEWFLGLEPPEDPFLPQRNQLFFALFSVAAAIYRWVVVLSILWFLYKVWEPYRLERIGQALALASLYGLFVYPLYKVGKFFYVPGRLDKVKLPRFYASLGTVLLILAAIVAVPLPHHVICTLELQPREAKSVYVEVPGILRQLHVRSGERVVQGQLLATLQNLDLDLDINKVVGDRDQYQQQLHNLRQQRFRDTRAGAEIPQVAEMLDALGKQLADKQEDQRRLQLRAPCDGVVMPPPPQPKHEDPEGRLPTWSGIPLEPENTGAFLEQGTLFCQIGNPSQYEAVLVVDQGDLKYVAVGQEVAIKLDQLPTDTLRGSIEEIASSELKFTPRRLSQKAGGELASVTDPQSGAERPMSASYQARVPLDDAEGVLRIGLRGRGKIYAAWLPLGTRLWRFAMHTFNFRL